MPPYPGQIDERYVRHDAESASDPDARQQFDLLIAAAERHEFDILAVDIMDRLTRGGMTDFFTIYGKLNHAGVELKIATEPFEDSDEGLMFAGMRAYFGKKENSDRVRRVMRTKRGQVARGKPLPGGHDLYGYRWADATKTQRRFDDEDSAAHRTVRRIWDYFLHDAHPTLHAFALRLNADQVLAPRAYFGVAGAKGRWTAETIRLLLWNEEYWGGNDGKVKAFTFSRDPDQPEVEIPAFAPPYVTPQQAAHVHARLAANQEQHGGRPPRRDWLAEGRLLHGRIARCAECGWALTPYTYKRPRADGSLLTVYRCQQRAQFGATYCRGVAISAEVLEQALVTAVEEHLGVGRYLQRLFEELDRDAEAASARVRDIGQQIDRIRQKVANAAEFVMVHGLAHPLAPDVLAQAKLAKEELPTLEGRLNTARDAVEQARNNTGLREELTAWCAAWTDGFSTLSTRRQRDFLKALGAEVRLWREGERTPRARLWLRVPTMAGVLLPPLDVEANREAFGDEAGVDADGIFVDVDRAASLVAWSRTHGRTWAHTQTAPANQPNSTKACGPTATAAS